MKNFIGFIEGFLNKYKLNEIEGFLIGIMIVLVGIWLLTVIVILFL